MSQADDVFIKNFLIILGALVVFTIIAFVLARFVGFGATAQIQASPQAVAARIEPVGRVRVGQPGDEPVPIEIEASAPATEVAVAEQSGEQIYNTACMACHAAGVAGAPKLDAKDDWTTRNEQGFDVLVQHVINGLNAMPPRGGSPNLGDEEIERAVEYMLTEAGITAE